MSKDFIEKPIRSIADAFEEILGHQEKDDCSDLWFDVQSTKSFCEELLFLSIRKTRAEVLAAHLEALKDGVPIGADSAGYIYNVLSGVQPAAKALEELLRKSHRDGHACTSSLQAKEGRMVKLYSCGVHEPIGLEKVRASEGKG